MSKELTVAQKKEWAQLLYTKEKLNQNVVAKKVGVTESTMSKWVNEYNWKRLRTRLVLTQDEQLNNFYEMLINLNEEVMNGKLKRPDTRQADVQIKLTTSIKNLQTDLGIEAIVQAGILYIRNLQKTESPAFIMEETDRWHSFIQSQLKK